MARPCGVRIHDFILFPIVSFSTLLIETLCEQLILAKEREGLSQRIAKTVLSRIKIHQRRNVWTQRYSGSR
jgi:hypothetical protein